MNSALLSSVLLASLLLNVGCQKQPPTPSCKDTLRTVVINGQRAFESTNGLHVKDGFPVFGCTSHPYSENPADNKYVQGGLEYLHWYQGKLYDAKDTALAEAEGRWPKTTIPSPYATIVIEIKFGHPQAHPDWWYSPAVPHALYPIDLLPNFGRDAPVDDAAIKPLKDTDSIYWKVRGGPMGAVSITRCEIKPRQDATKSDRSSLTDPSWLIRGETEVRETLGNTCRGYVAADNNKPLGARIDVPGAALKDIDKIYVAVARHISEWTID